MAYLMIFSLLLALLSRGVLATYPFSSGHCIPLPATSEYRSLNPCAGVVNYQFYLQPGKTLLELQIQASQALNNTVLVQLPSTCLSDYVSLVCAKIYLKCYPGVNLANTSTYDYVPYSQLSPPEVYGIPFQRPCGTVCSAVTTNCVNAVPYFASIFGTPNCAVTYDYSHGDITAVTPTEFDNTNTASQCFTPQTVTLAGAAEQYTASPSAPCSGYVNEFLIPSANKLNANLTLLQLPGVVQGLLNTQLSTQFGSIPAFVPSECFNALIAYECYSLFLNPVKQTIRVALTNGGSGALIPALTMSKPTLLTQTFTIPEFPPQSVCFDFETACSALFPQLELRNPSLVVNCSGLVAGTTTGTHTFPTGNQTVAAVSLKVNPSVTAHLAFRSGPNNNLYYNESQLSTLVSTYNPSCPTGYVIPEDPDHAGNRWVSGTACALSCISPEFDPHEWKVFRSSQIAFPIVGFVLGISFLIFLIASSSIEDTYLLFLFAVFSIIASIDSMYVSSYSYEDAFCYNNAIQREQHSDQYNSNFTACTAQGAILVYTYFACCVTTVLLALDWRLKYYPTIYLTIQEQYKYLYWGIQFFCAVVLSLIPMLYAFVSNLLGFSRSSPWCYIRSYPFGPTNVDVAVMGIPILILVIIYFIIFCWIDLFGFLATVDPVVHYGKNNNIVLNYQSQSIDNKNESTLSIAHKRAVHIAIGVTIFITLVIFVPYIAARGVSSNQRDTFLDALSDWTKCVFSNYTPDSPDNCFYACGWHPNRRPLVSLVPAQIYSLTGNMLLIAPTYVLVYFIAYYHYYQSQSYDNVTQNNIGSVELVGKEYVIVDSDNVEPTVPATMVIDQEKGNSDGAVIELTETGQRI